MDKIGWILLVVLAGALLPLQAAFNAKMGKKLASPMWAALISFAVGTVALVVYVLVTKTSLHSAGFTAVPPFTWLAGICGAFYVAVIVLAFPRLGPALTFGLVVAGQLLISLALDHFNILVQEQHSINLYRIVGMLMVIGGVVLLRNF